MCPFLEEDDALHNLFIEQTNKIQIKYILNATHNSDVLYLGHKKINNDYHSTNNFI